MANSGMDKEMFSALFDRDIDEDAELSRLDMLPRCQRIFQNGPTKDCLPDFHSLVTTRGVCSGFNTIDQTLIWRSCWPNRRQLGGII